MKLLALFWLTLVPLNAWSEEVGLKSGSDLVSWLLSTLVVVGVIVILAIAIKKTRLKFGSSGRLQILSSINVGPKERVVELKAGEKRLLIGVASGQVSFLCALEPEKIDASDSFKQDMGRAIKDVQASSLKGGEHEEH